MGSQNPPNVKTPAPAVEEDVEAGRELERSLLQERRGKPRAFMTRGQLTDDSLL